MLSGLLVFLFLSCTYILGSYGQVNYRLRRSLDPSIQLVDPFCRLLCLIRRINPSVVSQLIQRFNLSVSLSIHRLINPFIARSVGHSIHQLHWLISCFIGSIHYWFRQSIHLFNPSVSLSIHCSISLSLDPSIQSVNPFVG